MVKIRRQLRKRKNTDPLSAPRAAKYKRMNNDEDGEDWGKSLKLQQMIEKAKGQKRNHD